MQPANYQESIYSGGGIKIYYMDFNEDGWVSILFEYSWHFVVLERCNG